MSFLSDLPPFLDDILIAIYILILGATIIRILLDTHSTSKTLGYLLLTLVLPVAGIIFYYSFGISYRHRKTTKRTADMDEKLVSDFNKNIPDTTVELLHSHPGTAGQFGEIIKFIREMCNEFLAVNHYQLLINGEEKFPEVLKTLAAAEKFIHMEYYDWENDTRGNQIKDLLLQKIADGIKVRIIYDAYASRKIKHNVVKELKKGGVEIYPIIKLRMVHFANRVNHRDHRKVIIVDGHTGFLGGINISDRYDNSIDTGLYWRDTHSKLTGGSVHSMQRHFMVHWNVCQPDQLSFNRELFPLIAPVTNVDESVLAQIVPGGPTYPFSNIMLTYTRIFALAKKKLYITNPYFIPNDTILNTLTQAAISGVDVRLMVPEKSDSALVGAALKFYFIDLLQAGVRIFLYKKGFVHAKTVVADTALSIVGTANMDIRSFELNYEMMSVIYGNKFAGQLEDAFMNDLKECDEVNYEEWQQQGAVKKLAYAIARLMSSFL